MRVSRVNFNPCEYKGFVYLCGYGAFLMEAFDPQISRFIPFLTVTLAWNSQSLMFVEGGQLVVLSDRHITRLNWVEGSGKQSKLSIITSIWEGTYLQW